MTDLKKQPMSTYTFAPSSAYALSTHEVKIDKDRSRRPHLHELPAPPEAQGLKWLTAYRTNQDGAEQMLELWNHYRKRTAPCTSSGLPRQRDGPKQA